jgi:hypothetical protein
MRMSLRLAMATGCLTGVLSAEAKAQELDPRLYPKFEFDASATLLLLSENIRVDPLNQPGEGTEINAEDVLGVSETSLQPRAALRWRPGKRHELEVGFLRVVRSAEKVLVDTLTFSDTTFAAGLRINSNLRTSQAFLTYRYAFRVRPESQIGAGVGLGAIFLKNELDAVGGATTGGPDTTIAEYSRTSSFTAPTLSVGLYGRFKLGEKWYLDSDARGVYFAIENFKAGVAELGLAARRFFSNTFGAELGYTLGFYTVELEKSNTTGERFLDIDVAGKIKYTVNGFRGGAVFIF